MTRTAQLTIALAAFILLGAAALFFAGDNLAAQPRVEVKGESACAGDTLMCPDGTRVGRVPPECDFAQCTVTPAEDDFFKG